jgi:hypothetical protein
MRRIYYLMTLVLAFCFSGTTMAEVHLGGIQTTGFTNGEEIVIRSASSGQYANEQQHTAKYDDSNVFVLEDAGITVDGNQTFYVKYKTSGKYIGKPTAETLDKNGGDTGSLPYADAKTDAANFQIQAATTDLTKVTPKTGITLDQCVVLIYKDASLTKYPVLYYNIYGPNFLSTYTDTNCMVIYTVDNTAKGLLYELLMNNSLTDYTVGTAFGTYPQSLVDAYTTAYNAAQAALTSGTDIQGAYDALTAAIATIKTGVNKADGYYRIVNSDPDFMTKQNVEKAMYTNNAQKGAAMWNTIDLTSADFIWKISPLADGNYTIQNLTTGTYINKNNSGVKMSATPTTEQTIKYRTETDASSEPRYTISNTVDVTAYHANNHGSGSGVGSNIVLWDADINSASCWNIRKVSDDELNAALNAMKQATLKATSDSLLLAATTKYNRAVKSTITPNDSLVIDATQFSSNAVEPKEGSLAALLDGNWNTYFHSDWSTKNVTEPHYLQAALDNPVQTFSLQFTKRHSNNNNRPTRIIVSATNDATDANSWVKVWELGTDLPTQIPDSSYTSPMIDMGAAYKNVRFTVLETNSGATNSSTGQVFFTMKSCQLYGATVDADALINSMTAEATALKTAIGNSFKATAATQELNDALASALAAFSAKMADPIELNKAIAADTLLLKNAVVGSDPGNFTQESVDAFKIAILAAQVAAKDPNATSQSLNAALTALNAATATFNASAVNSVVANHWYYIKGSAKGASYMQGKVLYYNQTNDNVLFGNLAGNETNDNYLWRFIDLGDNHFAIQNKATTQFMGMTDSAGVKAHAKYGAGAYVITPIAAGAFIIAEDGQAPIHAQATGTLLVNWENRTLGSASCWTFQSPADLPMEEVTTTFTNAFTVGKYIPMCIPVDVSSIENATLFTVCGATKDADGKVTAINIKEITKVTGGEPFLLFANDPTLTFHWGTAGAYKAGVADGLVGNYLGTTVLPGNGYFDGEKVVTATKSTPLIANSAYINVGLITSNEEGEATINVDGTLNGISSITGAKDAPVSVYTVTGVRVRANVKAAGATTGLPKGIYIVGGRKVVVK